MTLLSLVGMAIRMAQDMGLFRDVDRWCMPVARFSHEGLFKIFYPVAVCIDK